MVELCHTPVTDPAVLGPQRPDRPAGVAQPQDVRTQLTVSPMVFPLVVVGDLLDRSVVVLRVLG